MVDVKTEYFLAINVNGDFSRIIEFLKRRIRKNEGGFADYLRQILDIYDPLAFDLYSFDIQKTALDHHRSIVDRMTNNKHGFLLVEVEVDEGFQTVDLGIFRAVLALNTPLKKGECFIEIKGGGATLTFAKRKIPPGV